MLAHLTEDLAVELRHGTSRISCHFPDFPDTSAGVRPYGPYLRGLPDTSTDLYRDCP